MTIIRIISESIRHIEDLPVDEFINVLKNMAGMTSQEKLDGANLWIGLDDQGKFFTSREGKRTKSDRKYSVQDWPMVSAFNQFRAAHTALEQRKDIISKILHPGDIIEIEVLFGKQPNSVIYGAGGKSYIAFLRDVSNNDGHLSAQLSDALDGSKVQAKCNIVDTADGEKLNEIEQSFDFEFTSPQELDSSKLKIEAGVDDAIEKLENFLSESSGINDLTNYELLSINLQKVDKSERDHVKKARQNLLSKIQVEFKLPIKQQLLDKAIRNVKSTLSDGSSPDDIGIEGIVLRNPETGDQIKIVDKDVFSTINKFNQSARQSVQSALNTVDPDASVESRGGLMGELRIKIAELFGNRDLAKAANVRKVLEPIKGNSPEDAIKNLADSMSAINDFQMIKKKILALTSQTAKDLKVKLDDFKNNKDDYRLKLKNGKEIGLTDDTVKKTLLTFAEARKNLTHVFEKVKKTESLPQLLAVLYGSQAKAVHQVQDLEESLILEKKKLTSKKSNEHGPGDVIRTDFEHKDLFQLVNAYLVTVFMTMLIFHEEDKIGMRLLRDRSNMGLKRWTKEMSPLNHWGYVIWRNAKPDVKKQLAKKTQKELFAATRHVLASGWKFLHMDFSYSKDVKVDWTDHRKTLQRLIDLSGLRSERLNSMLDWMVRWPELSYDEKVKAIGKLYLLAMQFTPKSTLFNRLRVIQQNLLLNATGNNDQMVQEGKLLKAITSLAEDGEPGGDFVGQSVATTVTATQANAVASNPMRIGGAHAIIRRKRNPETVKRLTMKFPDPRKEGDK